MEKNELNKPAPIMGIGNEPIVFALVPKLKNITINDVGIIKEAKLNFKDGLNIVTGSCGSGKTTALKEISKQNSGVPVSEIISNMATGEKIMFFYGGLFKLLKHRHPDNCLLVDDLFGVLDQEKITILTDALKDSKIQVITTSANPSHIKKLKANLIDTKSFKLKVGEI